MLRKSCWFLSGVISCLILILQSGCGGKRQPDIVIVAFFDVSGSTVAVRSHYKTEFETILKEVEADSRSILLVGDRITANTEATSKLPLKVRFEASEGMLGNPLKEKQAREKAVQNAKKSLDNLLSKSEPASDIMSSFRCASKVFGNYRNSKHKILVIFSDMVEQSSRYDFYSYPLNAKNIQRIIQQEREQGRIPNLEGVQVWIVGFASAEKGGLPPKKIKEIEDFWVAYLQAANAEVDRNRISQSLIGFELPQE